MKVRASVGKEETACEKERERECVYLVNVVYLSGVEKGRACVRERKRE